MKQGLIILLAVLMLFGLIACGPSGSSVESTNESVSESTTEAPKYLDSLEDKNFNGAQVILMTPEMWKEVLFGADEYINEAVPDMQYTCFLALEERFEVDIMFDQLAYDKTLWNQIIGENYMAGDSAYDILLPEGYFFGTAVPQYFYNLNNMDMISWDSPWWYDGYNDQSEIYGNRYYANGSFNMYYLRNMEAIYFNKQIIEDESLEDPYQLVADKTWTLAKMKEMAIAGKNDINGDGVIDFENDRYGLALNPWSGAGIFYSLGVQMVVGTDDGGLEIVSQTDSFYDIYDRVYDLAYSSEDAVYLEGTYNFSERQQEFMADRLLFLAATCSAMYAFREMVTDYGIIPFPMLDETQGNYISYWISGAVMCIPANVRDAELAGYMLEALNAMWYQKVYPTFYEDLFVQKGVRDTTSTEMLDLIVETSYVDCAMIYQDAIPDYYGIFWYNGIGKGNKNFASAFARGETMYKGYLTEMLDAYKNALES